MSLTAYIRYDHTGRIVPGGPIVVKDKPAVGNWQAVSAASGTSVTLSGKLRAFVKVDRYNKPVAGTLFLGKEQPNTGKWIEVNATFAVTTIPTTSTTTTTNPITTTTTTTNVSGSPMYGVYTDANNTQWSLKNTATGIYEGITMYSQFLVYFQGTLEIGTRLYRDPAFTDPITNGYGGMLWITLKKTQMNFSNLNGSQIVYTIDSNGYITATNLTIDSISYRYYPQSIGGNWYYTEGYSPYYPFTTNCSQYFNTAYTAPTVNTIDIGTTVYTSLSSPSHSPEFGLLSYNGNVYNVSTNGIVESLVTNCGGTTTTTTTTTTSGSSIVTAGLILNLDAANPASYPGTGSNWMDLSGNSNNGSFVGGITSTTYNGYGVLQTNGTGTYINVPSPNLATSNFTVMGATRYNGPTKGRMISGLNNNWILGQWIGTTENYFAEGFVSGVGAGPDDTNWRIYTATGDISGDLYDLYINNVQLYSNNGGTAGPNGFGIGAYAHGGTDWTDGQISFLLVYDRVLTPTEITQNYEYFRTRFGL